MPLLRCSGTRRGGEQEVDARLTPDSILHRTAKAERITGVDRARIATITENGNTWTQLIVVKAPDKILIRNEYLWMHLVRYFGFDGKHAWTSCNFGGGGLVQPSVERYIKSTLAWYTSADMIPGRWPVKVLRLPDRAVDGRSYFAIEEFPEGGNPSTLLVDKGTYESAGVSSVPGRYLKCTQRPNIASICTHEDVISGGGSWSAPSILLLCRCTRTIRNSKCQKCLRTGPPHGCSADTLGRLELTYPTLRPCAAKCVR